MDFRRALHFKRPNTQVSIVSFALATLFFTLAFSSTSHAASDWDGLVHPWTDLLQVCHTAGSDCTDVTATYASMMASTCSSAYSSFVSAASNPNGHVVILQGTDSTSSMRPWYVRIGWFVGSGGSELTQFYSYGYPTNYKISVYETRFVDLYWDGTANTCYDYGSGSYNQDIGQSPAPYTDGVYLSTYPVSYPSGYVGDTIPDGTAIDHDGDGLSAAQEFIQGTSDGSTDTDNDGIDDLKESIWFEDRDDVFCKTSVSPHVCAYPDPKKKDVYVEVDWMNDGTTDYKPTSTQLSRITDLYSEHDINLHFDMGEYGGGNELATYTSPLLRSATPSEVDYFDYKSGGDGITANFSSDRESIWHYMITGNKYTEDTLPSDSSGWGSGMGSNIFIAIGRVRDILNTSWEDKGITNTIAHEIGHNLCLTSSRLYNEQPAQCAYAGIDNKEPSDDYYDLEDYESVMNYRYQLRNDDGFGDVDYSDGSNIEDDHDDWASIQSGLGKFNIPLTLYVEFGARNSNAQNSNAQVVDPDGKIIIE